VVEVIIDGQGRMIDYTITQGPSVVKNNELRRLLRTSCFSWSSPRNCLWQAPVRQDVSLVQPDQHHREELVAPTEPPPAAGWASISDPPAILERLAEAACPGPEPLVVEIGAGVAR